MATQYFSTSYKDGNCKVQYNSSPLHDGLASTSTNLALESYKDVRYSNLSLRYKGVVMPRYLYTYSNDTTVSKSVEDYARNDSGYLTINLNSHASTYRYIYNTDKFVSIGVHRLTGEIYGPNILPNNLWATASSYGSELNAKMLSSCFGATSYYNPYKFLGSYVNGTWPDTNYQTLNGLCVSLSFPADACDGDTFLTGEMPDLSGGNRKYYGIIVFLNQSYTLSNNNIQSIATNLSNNIYNASTSGTNKSIDNIIFSSIRAVISTSALSVSSVDDIYRSLGPRYYRNGVNTGYITNTGDGGVYWKPNSANDSVYNVSLQTNPISDRTNYYTVQNPFVWSAEINSPYTRSDVVDTDFWSSCSVIGYASNNDTYNNEIFNFQRCSACCINLPSSIRIPLRSIVISEINDRLTTVNYAALNRTYS